MNELRSHAIEQSDHSYLNYTSTAIYHNDHTLVLRRGSEGNQIITALTNIGASSSSSGPYTITIEGTGLEEGDVVRDVLSCKTFKAGVHGVISFDFERGHPRVFYPVADEDSPTCESAWTPKRSLDERSDEKSMGAYPPMYPVWFLVAVVLVLVVR